VSAGTRSVQSELKAVVQLIERDLVFTRPGRCDRIRCSRAVAIEYHRDVSTTDCPKCYLPKEESAWYCDGCGHEFTQDFESVRSGLQAELRATRTRLWLTLIASLALVGVVVYLAMQGWIYLSVPLALGVVGSIGHAAHKISVLRGHLQALDRRHVRLPKATIRQDLRAGAPHASEQAHEGD
jgi:hypothetical protein